MADDQPKLKVVRRRRKSVKSRIRARANEQAKLAALEARKVAALEYVGELLEEAIGLLKAEGFKASRMRDVTIETQKILAQQPVYAVQNPCTWCGHEGVMLNEDKSGWVCQAHAQYEVGGGIQSKQGRNLFEQMNGKPVVQARPMVRKPPPTVTAIVEGKVVPVQLPPPPAKMVIHPIGSEAPIDPLKGASDAAANAGVDSDEAGTQ